MYMCRITKRATPYGVPPTGEPPYEVCKTSNLHESVHAPDEIGKRGGHKTIFSPIFFFTNKAPSWLNILLYNNFDKYSRLFLI